MTKRWKAETYKHAELHDADFPWRETSDEAVVDAENALSSLSDSERRNASAAACEWVCGFGEDGELTEGTTTGKTRSV